MTDLTYGGAAASREFRVGAVLRRALDIFGKNPWRFLLLAALAALPFLVLRLAGDPTSPAWQPVAVTSVVQAVLAFLVEAATVYGAFQQMRGRAFTLGESIGKCTEQLLPLLGAAVVTGVGMTLGLIALVLPGLFLAVIWSMAAPACVVERLGVRESISRSFALTRGYRWKILALVLIFLLGGLLLRYVATLISIAAAAPVLGAFLIFAVAAIWGALNSIATAVAYYDLRAIKEGISLDQIVGVFD